MAKEIKTICDFAERHKTSLCFIYGGGPSLHFINTTMLKDYVSISVNSGILKSKWCDYFVSDDRGILTWDYGSKFLKTLNCTKFLYKDKFDGYLHGFNNVVLFSHTWYFSPSDKKYNLNGIQLTKNEPIIGAINSVGSAVHIAYIMGCNPIVLLGCDCCYKDGKRYFWQYNGEEKAKRINNGIICPPDIFYEKNYSDMAVKYWNDFSKVNKNVLNYETMVIDASDGVLDCFPKMSIDSIVKKYGDRKKGEFA